MATNFDFIRSSSFCLVTSLNTATIPTVWPFSSSITALDDLKTFFVSSSSEKISISLSFPSEVLLAIEMICSFLMFSSIGLPILSFFDTSSNFSTAGFIMTTLPFPSTTSRPSAILLITASVSFLPAKTFMYFFQAISSDWVFCSMALLYFLSSS